MELNFDKYTLRRTVYEGRVTESVDIPSSIVMDEILFKYKYAKGIDTNLSVVKVSDYKDKIQEPHRDYYPKDVKQILNINTEYAFIEEWSEVSGHDGIYIRIMYGGEATEEDYKVETALKRIEEILDSL